MNTQAKHPHLTTSQLDALLFAPEASAADDHLRTCTTCAAELASLRETLTTLRSAATATAAHQHALAARNAHQAARSQRPIRLIGSFAAATLALAIGLPIALHRTPPAHPAVSNNAPQPAQAAATNFSSISDDQLLSSVQSDLSASVPDPMLPLESATTTQSK